MRLRLFPLLALLLLAVPAFALSPEKEVKEAGTRLHHLYPAIPVTAIGRTPIAGLFEVVDNKDNIFYFSPATGCLIAGEIYAPGGRNLTRERYAQIMSAKYDQIPLDQGLKIGSGPNIVVEVTDPDCPYCRNGAAWLAQRKDVTRYVFFTPLTHIHPDSEKKARFILSSPHPAETYQDVMDGLYDDKPLPKFKDNGRFAKQLAIIKKLGTKGTPNYWVNGHFVSGSNHKQLERYFIKH